MEASHSYWWNRTLRSYFFTFVILTIFTTHCIILLYFICSKNVKKNIRQINFKLIDSASRRIGDWKVHLKFFPDITIFSPQVSFSFQDIDFSMISLHFVTQISFLGPLNFVYIIFSIKLYIFLCSPIFVGSYFLNPIQIRGAVPLTPYCIKIRHYKKIFHFF